MGRVKYFLHVEDPSLQASLPSHGPVIYCLQEGEVCSAFHNQLKGKLLVSQEDLPSIRAFLVFGVNGSAIPLQSLFLALCKKSRNTHLPMFSPLKTPPVAAVCAFCCSLIKNNTSSFFPLRKGIHFKSAKDSWRSLCAEKSRLYWYFQKSTS